MCPSRLIESIYWRGISVLLGAYFAEAQLVAIEIFHISAVKKAGRSLSGRAIAGGTEFDGFGIQGVAVLRFACANGNHRAVAGAWSLLVVGDTHGQHGIVHISTV